MAAPVYTFSQYFLKVMISCCVVMLPCFASAQKDSSNKPITLTAYAELYYAAAFKKSTAQQMPSFIYSYNRLKEATLNLGFVKVSHTAKNSRAAFALAAGTYINTNLAAEPGVLKNVFEANAGIKLSKEKNIWIDAGIFPSHIGFESAIGKDNPTLTRSLLAENSPYYEAGVKITHTTANDKLTVSLLYLNGWQRMARPAANSTPAFGHQLLYKPSKNITVNSSSFAGSDKPDSMRQMRYFHNFFIQWQPSNALSITAGVDAGAEQLQKHSKRFNSWYTPVVIAKLLLNHKYSIAARAEYYADKRSVITAASGSGLQAFSASFNFDYTINSYFVWRTELRTFASQKPVFEAGSKSVKNSSFITSAIAVSF